MEKTQDDEGELCGLTLSEARALDKPKKQRVRRKKKPGLKK